MTVPLAPCVPPEPTTLARRTGASNPPALRAATTAFHRLLYLLTALPLGALWLAVLISGWVFVVVLAITPLLPAALIAFDASVRFAVWVEGYLARRLLGAPVAPRRIAAGRRSYWGSVGGVLGDGRFWAGQAFLLLRFVLGLVTAVLVLSVLAAGLEGVFAPVVYRFVPTEDANGLDFGFWLVDTLREAMLLVPVGLILLAWGIGLLHGSAALWRQLATSMLGGWCRTRRRQDDDASRHAAPSDVAVPIQGVTNPASLRGGRLAALDIRQFTSHRTRRA
jgi:hypothetical protein